MSKLEKEIKRLQSKPKDFTYDEAKKLLNKLGYFEDNKGKTSGSKVMFEKRNNKKIEIHKPHPSKVLKPYQINIILKCLEEDKEYEKYNEI